MVTVIAATVTLNNPVNQYVLNQDDTASKSKEQSLPYINVQDEKLKKKNIVYRALNEKDAENVTKGIGIVAKSPKGIWTAYQHILFGSTDAAKTNDPWISTTPDINVAKGFDSGYGIVAIDLDKVPTEKVYQYLQPYNPKSNDKFERIAYHRAVWSREISIKYIIPQGAVIGYVKY